MPLRNRLLAYLMCYAFLAVHAILGQNAELIDSDQIRSTKPTNPFIVNADGKLTFKGEWTLSGSADGLWYTVSQVFEPSPAPGATAPGSSTIDIIFNEVMDMATVPTNLSVKDGADLDIAGTWTQNGAMLTFTPETVYFPGDSVTVAFTDQLQGSNGLWQPINFSWSFSVDNTPNFTSQAQWTVEENNTLVGTVTVDHDLGASVNYTLSGLDAALFQITNNGNDGILEFVEAPDYEHPQDIGGDQVYDVTVTAADGPDSRDQILTITVQDVNDLPVFTSTSVPSLDENLTFVQRVLAADQDLDTLTFSLVGGVDLAAFDIDPTLGDLTFSTPPNFDDPGDADGDNVYEVTVAVNDGIGLDVTQDLAVTVLDVNEPPTITLEDTLSLDENQTLVTSITAEDEDAGTTLSYALAGGADVAFFDIDAITGYLTMNTPPDYEVPSDANSDRIYEVTVAVSDGFNPSVEQDLAIDILNIVDPPTITSPSTNDTPENTTDVVTLSAVGEVGATLVYTIIGGTDQGLFEIEPSSNLLRFIAAPNFEDPADLDANNTYEVQIRVSDGALFTDQAITINLIDVNEPPSIETPASVDIFENQIVPLVVWADDEDANSVLTYSVIGGPDFDDFNIDADDGTLSFVTFPNFENPTDSDLDNTYIVEVAVSDGEFTDTQTITITATDRKAFLTRWNANKEGGKYVLLPVWQGALDDDYAITWGDGTIDFVVGNDPGILSHDYPADGPDEYVIAIEGKISGWKTGGYGWYTFDDFLEVMAWGDLTYSGNGAVTAFKDCANLEITAIDTLDLTNATYINEMFRNCTSITSIPSINAWDVANVRSMDGVFQGATNFNSDLDLWDVREVKSMGSMFQGASQFNGAIGSWVVSNVEDMSEMFQGASTFNQDIGNWNMGNIEFIKAMFHDAENFNRDLDSWALSNIKDFSNMFRGATNFDGKVSTWNMDSARSLSHMFDGASSFNQDVNAWDVGGVTDFSYMFALATSFNQDLDNWRPYSALNMSRMFLGASSFNGIVDIWFALSGSFPVEDLSAMFMQATSFNQHVTWNNASPKHVIGMFQGASAFNKIVRLDLSNVKDMAGFFKGAVSFNQPLFLFFSSGYQLESLAGMFAGASSFNQEILLPTITVKYMNGLFDGATAFNKQLNPSHWDFRNVETMDFMFRDAIAYNQNMGAWNIESVTTMSNMLVGSGLSVGNYDATLAGWSAQNVRNDISLTATGLEYCDEASRDILTDTYGWRIFGDALSSSCGSARSAENLEVETTEVLEDVKAIEGLRLYPNPADHFFVLEMENFEGVWATLSDLSGKVVSVPVELKYPTTEFDLGSLTDRILFLHLDRPDGSVTLRILRQD